MKYRRDFNPTLDYNQLGCNSLLARNYNLFMFYILTAFPPLHPDPPSAFTTLFIFIKWQVFDEYQPSMHITWQ